MLEQKPEQFWTPYSFPNKLLEPNSYFFFVVCWYKILMSNWNNHKKFFFTLNWNIQNIYMYKLDKCSLLIFFQKCPKLYLFLFQHENSLASILIVIEYTSLGDMEFLMLLVPWRAQFPPTWRRFSLKRKIHFWPKVVNIPLNCITQFYTVCKSLLTWLLTRKHININIRQPLWFILFISYYFIFSSYMQGIMMQYNCT